MKTRYYFDRDDIYRRYIRPWAVAIIVASLVGLGIWWLIDTNIKNSAEYKRQAEISESLSKAPEEGDIRENIPDEEIGNYYYNGGEIIDYPDEIYLVKKVVSGNEIVVRFQGQDVRLKIIGIQIPSCYDKSAKEYLSKVALNRRVKIDFDSKTKEDKNGTVLAYVGLDTFDLGRTLVSNGVAKVDSSIDYSMKELYLVDQEYAKFIKVGLWDNCSNNSSNNSSNKV